jgi:hypothetical protein
LLELISAIQAVFAVKLPGQADSFAGRKTTPGASFCASARASAQVGRSAMCPQNYLILAIPFSRQTSRQLQK